MAHEHNWKLAFTETKDGSVIASTYHCACGAWKTEAGGELQQKEKIRHTFGNGI